MSTSAVAVAEKRTDFGYGGLSLVEIVDLLVAHAKLLLVGPFIAGVIALATVLLMTPQYAATTTLLPPQPPQSATASAIASLGSLAGLAGGNGAVRTSADQYVALMQSVTVSDRLIERFKLMDVYGAKYRVDARRQLAANVRLSVGKKDGMITVEVEDSDPRRAADIANRYVQELQRVAGELALTEAQQRRAFFEQQLRQSKDNLLRAQQSLEGSGFNAGALQTEPRAAADAYARLRSQVTGAELRLQGLRGSFADGAPEIRQQESLLSALRLQLTRAERPADATAGSDYIGRYREFKYQETLFDLYARQFELARVDESREGTLIQVVDLANPPERKSRPKRALVVLTTIAATAALLAIFIVVRASLRGSRADNRHTAPVIDAAAR